MESIKFKVDSSFGKIESISSDNEITKELLALKNEQIDDEQVEIEEDIYSYLPSKKYKSNKTY